MTLPTCPRDDCRATIDHGHGASSGSYACMHQLASVCPYHDQGLGYRTRCYASRTATPAPQLIDPADVRVGDRVRLTIDGVVMMTPDRRIDISDLVGLLDDQPYTEKVYLVDRPDPDAPLVGTIARVIASGAGARAVLDALRAEYVIEPKAVQS